MEIKAEKVVLCGSIFLIALGCYYHYPPSFYMGIFFLGAYLWMNEDDKS